MKRRKLVLGILTAALAMGAVIFASLKDTHKQANSAEAA